MDGFSSVFVERLWALCRVVAEHDCGCDFVIGRDDEHQDGCMVETARHLLIDADGEDE